MVKNRQRDPATALLDAHVAYVLAQLQGDALAALLETEVDAALKNAARLKLDDCVTREQIKQTARAYASELRLGGGIPELVGETARELYAQPIHASTRIGELLPDRLFEEMLDKLLEMGTSRERVIREAIANPGYTALVSDLLYHGIRDYLSDSTLARSIPGAQTMMKLGRSAMNKASPKLEASIEQQLKKFIGRNLHATLLQSERFLIRRIEDGAFRESVLDTWALLRDKPVSAFREYLSADDVEDFFVIGYDSWLALRQTLHYQTLIDAGIDCFFDKYGKSTLKLLLDDIGIDRSHLMTEALRYAPHVLGVLKRKKLLEPIVRRNLEPFYASPQVAAILSNAS